LRFGQKTQFFTGSLDGIKAILTQCKRLQEIEKCHNLGKKQCWQLAMPAVKASYVTNLVVGQHGMYIGSLARLYILCQSGRTSIETVQLWESLVVMQSAVLLLHKEEAYL
jgi:hypothetical protein